MNQVYFDKLVREKKEHTEFAFTLSILLFASFGVLDWFLFPSKIAMRILPLRAAYIIIACGVLVIIKGCTEWYFLHSQRVLSFMVFAAASALISITYSVHDLPHGDAYYPGMILVVMFLFTFLPIRFRNALMLAGIFVVATTLAYSGFSIQIQFVIAFFLLSSILIGAITCRNNEIIVARLYDNESLLSKQKDLADG